MFFLKTELKKCSIYSCYNSTPAKTLNFTFFLYSVSRGQHHWKIKIITIKNEVSGGTIFGLGELPSKKQGFESWAVCYGIMNNRK